MRMPMGDQNQQNTSHAAAGNGSFGPLPAQDLQDGGRIHLATDMARGRGHVDGPLTVKL